MELLPVECAPQNLPFQIIGIDSIGLLMSNIKGGKETKVYILLFTWGLTRAIHLEPLTNQSTQEFIMALND